MSTRSHGLSPELHDYLVQHTVEETDLQRRLREETRAGGFDADMQIAPEQGQFFRFLVQALGVKKALEVGTFTGYSSLAVAMALPEDGHIDCCDLSEEFTSVAKRYWEEAGVAGKVTLRLGPGLDTLDRMIASGASGHYDFAFIDSEKEGYPGYYDRCMRLLRVGGVLCFDNAIADGRVADPKNSEPNVVAIRETNRIAFADPKALATLVPIGDGLTMVLKLKD
ncbi:MAG: class I SAM-dependent methyltransferase [Fimbriimonadaceae bacterium]|nr:class I SAM-dependent methyltransferase [Fimbriimonadaceae bacterium]QYK56170.1 MAG: class I SAM-dependent methyltransferase [Fimbriimonadaceae bacterium]